MGNEIRKPEQSSVDPDEFKRLLDREKCCCDIFAEIGDTASIMDAPLVLQQALGSVEPDKLSTEMLSAALLDFFPSKMPGFDLWLDEVQAEEKLLQGTMSLSYGPRSIMTDLFITIEDFSKPIYYHRINFARAVALDEVPQYIAFAYKYSFISQSDAVVLATYFEYQPNQFSALKPQDGLLSPGSLALAKAIYEHKPGLYYIFGGETFLGRAETRLCNWNEAKHPAQSFTLEHKAQLPVPENLAQIVMAEIEQKKQRGPHKPKLDVIEQSLLRMLDRVKEQFEHIFTSLRTGASNFSVLQVLDEKIQLTLQHLGSVVRRKYIQAQTQAGEVPDDYGDEMPPEKLEYVASLEESMSGHMELKSKLVKA